ncbi:hypothetical protein TNCV_4501921 [Trichonephila clavipes]|nr:hypothetical protein TNCV_4501921 [Trichonephila clavipes]
MQCNERYNNNNNSEKNIPIPTACKCERFFSPLSLRGIERVNIFFSASLRDMELINKQRSGFTGGVGGSRCAGKKKKASTRKKSLRPSYQPQWERERERPRNFLRIKKRLHPKL